MKIARLLMPLALLVSPHANAAMVSFEFDGIMGTIDSDITSEGYGIGRHDLFRGHTFSGSLAFDTSTITSSLANTADRSSYNVSDTTLEVTVDPRPESPYNATVSHSAVADQSGYISVERGSTSKFYVYTNGGTGDQINDRFDPSAIELDWRFRTEIFDTTDLFEAMR